MEPSTSKKQKKERKKIRKIQDQEKNDEPVSKRIITKPNQQLKPEQDADATAQPENEAKRKQPKLRPKKKRDKPAESGTFQPQSDEPEFHHQKIQKEPEAPKSLTPTGYQPATFTGFRELAIGKAFLILLLWLPRLFIPWISTWYEFDVYLLSNPWHWNNRRGELLKHKIYVLLGKCVIAVLSALGVDIIRKRYQVDLYVYQAMLFLFTLSPMVGALVDVLLRDGFYETQWYKDWWFTSVVLMLWAMSMSFIMFPVQLACIYMQNDKMSRNAHYNWMCFLVMLEVISAYVAFLVIPGPCPTQSWVPITVWAIIFLRMLTVAVLTLIFSLAVKAWKYIMLMCCTKYQPEQEELASFTDAPKDLKMKKLMWFGMIIMPVICSFYSFSVIKGFVPHDMNDPHHYLSALGLFLLGNIVGVVVMFFVMFVCRKLYHRRSPFSLKTEMIFFGVPHCLFILGLLILVGRFSTLSRLNEGDVIVGPIPNKDKAVVVLINLGYRNTTMCVRSEYFPPARIRPYEHVTREVFHETEVFNVTVEIDPCYEPVIRRNFTMKTPRKGEWRIFRFMQFPQNIFHLPVLDSYRTLAVYELIGIERVLLNVGYSVVLFMEAIWSDPGVYFYQLNHSSGVSRELETVNRIEHMPKVEDVAEMKALKWIANPTGTWTIRWWSRYLTGVYINCSLTQCVTPLEFEVKNNSLYLIAAHVYEQVKHVVANQSARGTIINDYPSFPETYTIFKLAEIAGKNGTHLPSNQQLEKDAAVRAAMFLSGMAAGSLIVGFVYIFWVDPPIPRYRSTSLAACWALVGIASEMAQLKPIDVGVKVSIGLLCLQIFLAGLHFTGSFFMYSTNFNFRIRPD